MENSTIAAHVEDEQRAQSAVATTALVTEAKREILWLKGYGIFYVFVFGIVVQLLTDKFPIALIAAIAMFTFIKTFIDTKPDGYLLHLAAYALWLPKHLSYRSENRVRFESIKHLRKLP